MRALRILVIAAILLIAILASISAYAVFAKRYEVSPLVDPYEPGCPVIEIARQIGEQKWSRGTGWVYDKNTVVTAYHVVSALDAAFEDPAPPVLVKIEGLWSVAEVIKWPEQEVEEEIRIVPFLGAAGSVRISDDIVLLRANTGSILPVSMSNHFTSSTVSWKKFNCQTRYSGTFKYIERQKQSFPGKFEPGVTFNFEGDYVVIRGIGDSGISGSPLIDQSGKIVGMAISYDRLKNEVYAVTYERLMRFLFPLPLAEL